MRKICYGIFSLLIALAMLSLPNSAKAQVSVSISITTPPPRCRHIPSPFAQVQDISGRRGTGPGDPMDIIGCLERGCWRLKSSSCGRQAIGAGAKVCMCGTRVIGVRKWDFMAALTMDSDTRVWAT
jgi:hypothetical protein